MSAMAAWLARRIHIIRVLFLLCGLLLFSCWLNAAIHANSWTPPTLAFLTVSSLSCSVTFLSHLCLHTGCLCRENGRHHEPPWHKHGPS